MAESDPQCLRKGGPSFTTRSERPHSRDFRLRVVGSRDGWFAAASSKPPYPTQLRASAPLPDVARLPARLAPLLRYTCERGRSQAITRSDQTISSCQDNDPHAAPSTCCNARLPNSVFIFMPHLRTSR